MQVNVKVNYIVFAVIAIVVSMLGRIFSSAGMQWYYTLHVPSYVPNSALMGLIWTAAYVLTTVAAVLVWNNFKRDVSFYVIMALFGVVALCTLLWTYLFFYKHSICMAFADAVVLCAALLGLVLLTAQQSKLVAGLLVPVLVWVLFDTWLNAMIMILN